MLSFECRAATAFNVAPLLCHFLVDVALGIIPLNPLSIYDLANKHDKQMVFEQTHPMFLLYVKRVC